MPFIKFLHHHKKDKAGQLKEKSKSSINLYEHKMSSAAQILPLFHDDIKIKRRGSTHHVTFLDIPAADVILDNADNNINGVEPCCRDEEGVISSNDPLDLPPRKSSSCSAHMDVMDGGRDRRLTDIAQLDNYIDYLQRTADENNMASYANRLCCAQVLRMAYLRQEQNFINNALHARSHDGVNHGHSGPNSHRSSMSLPCSRTSSFRRRPTLLRRATEPTSDWRHRSRRLVDDSGADGDDEHNAPNGDESDEKDAGSPIFLTCNGGRNSNSDIGGSVDSDAEDRRLSDSDPNSDESPPSPHTRRKSKTSIGGRRKRSIPLFPADFEIY